MHMHNILCGILIKRLGNRMYNNMCFYRVLKSTRTAAWRGVICGDCIIVCSPGLIISVMCTLDNLFYYTRNNNKPFTKHPTNIDLTTL